MIAELTDTPAVLELLNGSSHLKLGCHLSPDGDALGSMIGLAESAAEIGKQVEASFHPFPLASQFQFLPDRCLQHPSKMEVTASDLFIAFDTASPDRLGPLEEPSQQADNLVVIDHHATNPNFGTHNLIVPTAAAAAEIVYHLLRALGWPITPTVATCLHTGIVTDTGRFQYSSTSADTLRVAADLVEAGADLDTIGQECYGKVDPGYMEVLGVMLSNLQIDPIRRLAWSQVSTTELETAGVRWEDTDQLIDVLRLPRNTEVAVLFKQMSPKKLKTSLRSRGRVDVGQLAVRLGGGGHHNAAGATCQHPSVSQNLTKITDYLDEFYPPD